MKNLLLSLALVACASSAQAVSYTFNSFGHVTSVTGLDVDGTTYDVTFDTRTDTEWLADLAFTSFADATTAANALNSALTDFAAARVATPSGMHNNDFTLVYGSNMSGELIGLHLSNQTTPINWFIFGNNIQPIGAVFTAAPVPVPAAGALLVFALGGLALMRRKSA